MIDKFACEMVFGLWNSLIRKERYIFFGGKLVSTITDLEEKGADLERDIFLPVVMESEQVGKLQDGIYKAFIIGNISWANMLLPPEDDEWIFEETEMVFIPLSLAPAIDSKGKI